MVNVTYFSKSSPLLKNSSNCNNVKYLALVWFDLTNLGLKIQTFHCSLNIVGKLNKNVAIEVFNSKNKSNETFSVIFNPGERFQILGRDFRSSLKRTYDEKDHIWEVRKKELLSWSHEIWRTIQVEKIMQLNMACQDFLAYWKVMVNKFTAAATTLGFIFEGYLKGNLLVDLLSAYLPMHNT